MRIAAKRLRYALEIFAPLFDDKLEIPIKSSRQAQQILGEIHDCDVWLLELPQFVEKEKIRIKRYLGHTRPLTLLLPGILYFQRNRQEERANRFRQFQQTWQKWRRVELWLNLKQNLLSAMIPNGEQTPVNPSPL